MLPDPGITSQHERLSVEYSYPRWMVSRWANQLGANELIEFLQWGNRRPHVTLRVNRLKSTPEELRAKLTEKGIASITHPGFPEFLSLEHTGETGWQELFTLGIASAQDISQGIVARLVDPQLGEEILDFCSAPGGKTGHLAELAQGASIVATDKAEERLDLVRDLVRRNGYENVRVVSYDEIVGSKRKFDAILVDAPCSGTGVLARRPDLRWRRSPDDIGRMSAVQLSLLHYAADRLKSKGRIIYSTCSVEPEENNGVVDRFLEVRRDFEERPVGDYLPSSIEVKSTRLSLLGTEFKTDGVFAAIIRKR